MHDSTLILRRWDDEWNELSLADQITGMELNTLTALYSDLRSPSRQRLQHRRKRSLNPVPRTNRCRCCLAHETRHLSSRNRRTRDARTECTPDAYWDEKCAQLEHDERVACSDLVALYYNHGHNAGVIESLHPRYADDVQDAETQEWVDVCVSSGSAHGVGTSRSSWVFNLSYPYPSDALSTTPDDANRQPTLPDAELVLRHETTFTYHRNLTGVWELGYALPYPPYPFTDPYNASADPYNCTQTPLPLSCSCCSYSCGFYPCYCTSYPAWWGDPEVSQPTKLVDWGSGMGGVGVWGGEAGVAERAEEKEMKEGRCGRGGGEWTFIHFPRSTQRDGDEWDIVSSLSSTGSWRLIDVT